MNLIKSKQRVADHGEVFTPEWLVEAMLDLVKDETERLDSRFLEPACGSGNFLTKILKRKLAAVEFRYGKSEFDRNHYALLSVMCIYGIEILKDNISECQDNILDVLVSYLNLEIEDDLYRSAVFVLSQNIVHGDALTMRDINGGPITFAEWGYLGKGKFQRRDFRFDVLTGSSAFSAEGSLFADLGRHEIFQPVKTYEQVTISQLAKNYEETMEKKIMIEQASFTLRNRNPDVLTCIANLSNDEVFTPPELANQMLDTLTQAWALNNNGNNLWEDKNVKFLDPCTKSGVFLREITTRLTKGLEKEIPNLEKRVDHILSKQVFGIGITTLTSLLARRSVYCSKNADGEHSIAKSLKSKDGNIWFGRTEHSWVNDRCIYCGASKSVFDRAKGFDTHAYAFIHSENSKTCIKKIFGDSMRFDVIIGNPPYQLDDGGVGGAMPLYQKFVQNAKSLEPKFLSMVTPSRWFAGGRGLDNYREEMLDDKRLRILIDYPKADEVFPGVLIGGGVSYFLWDSSYSGQCSVTIVRDGNKSTTQRDLNQYDIFVRSNEALSVLKKVLINSKDQNFSTLMSGPDPFGFRTNFEDYKVKPSKGDIKLHYNSGGRGAVRSIGYVSREMITRNIPMIDTWKLMLNRVYNVAESYPHRIVGSPTLLPPGEICTGSFLVAGPFLTETNAVNAKSYYETKFFRFLLHLRKINQDAARHSYQWVPMQSWDKSWTDSELYEKYNLSGEEIEYIESVIKPISLVAKEADDE